MKIRLLLLILPFSLVSHFSFSQAPTIEWQHSYGGSADDKALSAIQTMDGSYMIAGSTESVDGDVLDNKVKLNCWVIKLFSNGNADWKKCLGGETAHQGNEIIQTKDWCYVVAGSTMLKDGNNTGVHGNDDYWITKFNSTFIPQWTRTYGGKADDVAKSIRGTRDGGFIVAGWGGIPGTNITRNLGGNDFWIMKLNKQGSIKWQNSLGGSGMDNAAAAIQAGDDGYLAVGYSNSNNMNVTGNHGASDGWIVKTDSGGVIEWQKSIGGNGLDFIYSAELTKDKGFIFAGATESNDGDVKGNHGKSDAWIIKTDSLGNMEWQKCIGGSNDDVAYSVQVTNDGGYIIAGKTDSNDGDVKGNYGGTDAWIIKLDEKGTMIWQKCLGGTKNDQAKTIRQTNDGGYIISAFSNSADGDVTSNKGNYDYWIIKLKP